MASLITDVPNVCSTACSGTDQRKHQNSASLAFIHRHGWIPLIKDTNAENVSIRWRHHGFADIHSIHKPLRSSFGPGNTFGLQLFSSPLHFVPKHGNAWYTITLHYIYECAKLDVLHATLHVHMLCPIYESKHISDNLTTASNFFGR